MENSTRSSSKLSSAPSISCVTALPPEESQDERRGAVTQRSNIDDSTLCFSATLRSFPSLACGGRDGRSTERVPCPPCERLRSTSVPSASALPCPTRAV